MQIYFKMGHSGLQLVSFAGVKFSVFQVQESSAARLRAMSLKNTVASARAGAGIDATTTTVATRVGIETRVSTVRLTGQDSVTGHFGKINRP